MRISDFNPLNNTLAITAGEELNRDDLVSLYAVDGKAYRVRVTDYAAVPTMTYGTPQTSEVTGRLVAQTSIVSSPQTYTLARQAVVRAENGNIYTLTDDGASTGLRLTRFSAMGAVLSTVVIVAAASTDYRQHHLLLLSNGDLAVIAFRQDAEYAVRYAVYTANLVLVKALTSIESSGNGISYFSACGLSGGGFAIVYQQSANPLLSRLATFDNAGNVALAATTVWTRTGNSSGQYHKILQLSSGNLVIAVSSSNSTGSTGLYHGVVTTAGASVLAFTSLDIISAPIFPELSVLAGYYCISRLNGADQRAFICNNAGALQGAGFTGVTTIGADANANCKTKLLNDGAAFWLLWPRDGANSSEVLTKLPTTGTGYISENMPSMYSYYLDAFCEGGNIVIVVQTGTGNTAPAFLVASTSTGRPIHTSLTTFGLAPGTASGKYHRVIPGGDGTFICVYDQATSQSTNLCVGKYANTSIVGVAAATTAAGALVPVKQSAGAYTCNAIAGTITKPFDMSATTQLYGNKGTVMSNGVVLKGI